MTANTQIVEQLLKNLASERGQNISRHFDELGVCEEAYSIEFWRNGALSSLVRHLRDMGESQTILVVYPLGYSENITCSGNHVIDLCRREQEPPTLYLIEGNSFYDEANEEYRLNVSLFEDPILKCQFRSWRDDHAARNNWEFNNSVYVWSSLQGGEPPVIS